MYGFGANANGQLGNLTTTNTSSLVQESTLSSKWIGSDGIFDWIVTFNNSTYAIKVDGTLWSWGNNAYGKLGLSDTVHRSSPCQIGANPNWYMVRAGYDHAAAINYDGNIYIWGRNSLGQLGDNTTTHRSSPIQIARGSGKAWQSIACGKNHNLAILGNTSTASNQAYNTLARVPSSSMNFGTLFAYLPIIAGTVTGTVYYNAVAAQTFSIDANGTFSFTTITTAYCQSSGSSINYATGELILAQTATAGTGNIYAEVSYEYNSVGVNGTVWSWGSNSYGALGDNTTTHRSSPVQIISNINTTFAWAGYDTSLISSNGTYAWGRNDYGQLGLSDTTHRSSPTQMGYQNQWNQLSFGQFHTIATGSYNGSSNAFYTWGRNNYGQLGKNTITDSSTPALTVLDFIEGDGYAVAASADSSFVVRKNGTIWSWGRNYNNCSLGPISSTGDKSSPVQIVSSFVWQNVSGGAKYAVALSKNSSNLFASGTNTYGQLGDGFTSATSRRFNDFRQTFSNAPTWEKISAGHTFSLAIKQDSTLWAWGYNNIGQIGINNTANQSIPTQISGDFTLVSAGYDHAGAIKTDGSLVMFGKNTGGTLGDNTGINRSSPVQTVAGGTNWSKLSCGTINTGAIKTDGTLWMWGGNVSGSLGINFSSGIRSSPVQIGSNTTWSSISCGFYHTAAIKTDGTLWTWGDNLYGQLGDNTTINRSSPIQTVAGGTTWSQVACGWKHTAAIKTNGTLWSWGDNSYGQLGDGTITQRSSPIQEIGAGTTWTFVSVPVFSNSTLALKSDNKMYGAGDYFPSSYSSFTQFYTGDKTWMRVSKGGYHILAISYGKSPSPSGPTMFWPDPVPKASGYALSAETLNASVLADAGGQLPGSIIYDPAKGTVLSAGTQTLYATSLPTENYNTQTISRTITIT
jgi:alpha-tubulin suppressor-like RCC1 family protein